ncbi:porin [Herbaspirillum frisingense]|uniref:porin n=1 Tax=Herbaspirillum frisingense TaxID=92645 RepID=UPI001F15DCEE|nr:porin [Herbaspirillum frisingense]UIN19393.1 porin [Herbaspirillum frisingense]
MKSHGFASSLALGLLCLSGGAQGQSGVVIYGVIDAGVALETSRHAAGSSRALLTGGSSSSRLGFRGSEDLGNAWKAIFTLESGFSPDDGNLAQGGLLWGRKSFVGLSSPYGTLTLGRQDSPLYEYSAAMDPVSGALAFTRIFTLTSRYRRDNNTVKYASPTMYGFKGQLAYSFGEKAGSRASGRILSAGLNYTRGDSSSSLSMQHVNNQPDKGSGIKTTRLLIIGTRYDFQVAALSLMAQTNKSNEGSKAIDSHDLLLGVSVPMGSHKFTGSVIAHQDRRLASGSARQLGLGYSYAMSPRTSLYAGISHITNKEKARFGLVPVAEGGAMDGADPKLYMAGMKHVF